MAEQKYKSLVFNSEGDVTRVSPLPGALIPNALKDAVEFLKDNPSVESVIVDDMNGIDNFKIKNGETFEEVINRRDRVLDEKNEIVIGKKPYKSKDEIVGALSLMYGANLSSPETTDQQAIRFCKNFTQLLSNLSELDLSQMSSDEIFFFKGMMAAHGFGLDKPKEIVDGEYKIEIKAVDPKFKNNPVLKNTLKCVKDLFECDEKEFTQKLEQYSQFAGEEHKKLEEQQKEAKHGEGRKVQ